MKTTTFLSFVLAISAIAVSCKKESTTPPATSSGIIAKWSLISDTTKDEVVPTNAGDYTGAATDYWDFRTDGYVYVREDTFTDTTPYKILPNNKILFGTGIYSDTVRILTLTDNRATISIPLPPTSTQYVYLKK